MGDPSEMPTNFPKLQFRLVQPSEVDQYIDFLEGITDWLVESGIQQWIPGNFWRSKAYYAESVANAEVWMAMHGAKPVGTIRILSSEPTVWPDIEREDGVYVYNLAVGRDAAGSGVGKRLLEHADNQGMVAQRKYVRLDCMADNEFLKRYYANAGFNSCGEIEVRYPEPIGRLRLHRFERAIR